MSILRSEFSFFWSLSVGHVVMSGPGTGGRLPPRTGGRGDIGDGSKGLFSQVDRETWIVENRELAGSAVLVTLSESVNARIAVPHLVCSEGDRVGGPRRAMIIDVRRRSGANIASKELTQCRFVRLETGVASKPRPKY